MCPPRYHAFNRNLLPVLDETIDRVVSWLPKKPRSDERNSVRLFPNEARPLPMTDQTIERIWNLRPSPSADGRGLCLVGPPHIGKRRLLYALGENLFHAGFQIGQISGPDFDALAPLRTDRESGPSVRKRLNQLRSGQILILTDVGAEKLPESAQRELCPDRTPRSALASDLVVNAIFPRTSCRAICIIERVGSCAGARQGRS